MTQVQWDLQGSKVKLGTPGSKVKPGSKVTWDSGVYLDYKVSDAAYRHSVELFISVGTNILQVQDCILQMNLQPTTKLINANQSQSIQSNGCKISL